MSFHGSYEAKDVTFLLKPIDMPPTPVEEKERLIQSGERHYSELLAPEHPPSDVYLELFEEAFARNRERMARDLVALVRALDQQWSDEPFVLVSLARAGTPIGVLLRRGLGAILDRNIPHYSISIIRDRGIDRRALSDIQDWHPNARLIFVDGWSGKGAIARELRHTLADMEPPPYLTVLSDLAGVADLAAGGDDYLIPCAILNAVISGLVSRSILHSDWIGGQDYHGCVLYKAMREHDRSRWFVDELESSMLQVQEQPAAVWGEAKREHRRNISEACMAKIMHNCGIENRHRIKPGIGEATRAALRGVPNRVFVRDAGDPDVQHLLHLAKERDVPVDEDINLPYAALTVIRKLGTQHAVWEPPIHHRES